MAFRVHIIGSVIAWITLLAGFFPSHAMASQRCEFIVEIASFDGLPQTSKPGEVVRVAWELVDVNDCGWPDGMQLVFTDGERMSGPNERDLPRPNRGDPLKVSFDVEAPDEEGEHTGTWQLAQDGRVFGPRLFVLLLVVSDMDDFVEPLPDDQLPSDGVLIGSVVPETYMVTASEGTTLAMGEHGTSTVFCPDGVVVGGGWLLTGTAYGAKVYTSWRLDEDQGNGWIVSASNPSFLQATLWARAICLRNTTGETFTQAYWGLNVDPGETAEGSVPCPNGSVLTGGGFMIGSSSPGLELRLSGPKFEGEGAPINEWSLQVHNAGDSLKSAAQQAVCLTGVSAFNYRADSMSVAVLPINAWGPIPGYAVASCPAGTLPGSGGMSVLGDNNFNWPSSGLAGNGWMASGENPNITIYSMYSTVTCLLFP
jgi:hypothetical protein